MASPMFEAPFLRARSSCHTCRVNDRQHHVSAQRAVRERPRERAHDVRSLRDLRQD